MEKKFESKTFFKAAAVDQGGGVFIPTKGGPWTYNIDLPFKVGRIVCHPIVYNFVDAGANAANAYKHTCIMSDILRDQQPLGIKILVGVAIDKVYSTGMTPTGAYQYMLKEPMKLPSSFSFYPTAMDMVTQSTLLDQDLLITIDFYEA